MIDRGFHLKKISAFQWFEIILSIIAIVYLIFEVQTEQFLFKLSNINGMWYGIIYMGFLIKFLTKALKLRVLFDEKISVRQAFIITLKYNFYQNIIPFKAGDLTLIPLAKKEGFDSEFSFGAIIINNIVLYLLTSFLLIGFSILFFIFFPIELKIELLFLGLIILISDIIFLSIIIKPDFFVKLIISITEKFGLKNNVIIQKSIDFLNQTSSFITTLRSNRHQFIRIIWYSLLTLLTQIPIYWASLSALGFNLHPVETITFSFYIFFIQNLPLDLILNLGKFEIAWAAFWAYSGYDFSEQINQSFLIHSIHLILIVLFGLLGILLEKMSSKPSNKK